MRKGILSIITLLSCCVLFSGCIRNTPLVLTINPYLTATINTTDTFTSATVVPSTVDTQLIDTATALIITGNSSAQYSFTDKIILEVTDYKSTGVFSIIQSKAGAAYVHNNVIDPASNGIVAITQITSTSIIGYFSFSTVGGIAVTNGTFSVGKP